MGGDTGAKRRTGHGDLVSSGVFAAAPTEGGVKEQQLPQAPPFLFRWEPISFRAVRTSSSPGSLLGAVLLPPNPPLEGEGALLVSLGARDSMEKY